MGMAMIQVSGETLGLQFHRYALCSKRYAMLQIEFWHLLHCNGIGNLY